MMDEWIAFEDEWGTGFKKNNVTSYVTRSQKWHDENPPVELESQPPSEIELLKQENAVLQLAIAETIEKQEIDKVNNQIALAEVIETLTIKGVL